MSQIPEPPVSPDFWAMLKAFWPLALIGGLAGLARGFKKVCAEETWDARLIAFLLSTIPSAIVAFIGAMCIPFFFDKQTDPAIQIGIAGILGGLGTKSFDMLIRKVFRLSVVDLSDPSDVEQRVTDRLEHAKNCSFKAEHEALRKMDTKQS